MINKILLTALGFVVAIGTLCGTAGAQTGTQGQTSSVKLFYVYSDKDASNSNFFIPSGWMGDYADLTFDNGWSQRPYAGRTCIKITYSPKASGGARWTGIYWQNPAGNWGTQKNGGIDLRGVSRLTFWARGERGGEQIQEFKMGGIAGLYPDSDTAGIGPVVLTPEWKQYTIDLTGKDLSRVIGGFSWSTNLDVNPRGCTFYIDEIRYE